MQADKLESSGNSFIDSNHEGLLKLLDALTPVVRDNWDEEVFSSGVRSLIASMENHFSHEETVLKGAQYHNLEEHAVKHRELSMELRMLGLGISGVEDAVGFLGKARTKILSHELFEDQGYWPLFADEEGDEVTLIVWSTDYETGDTETDKHHKALINFINRLHNKLTSSVSRESVCSELKSLYSYSEFHFRDEEVKFGMDARSGHRIDHETLLRDLSLLIEEIGSGVQDVRQVGEYLKYWILNHIQTFDIPSFRR